MRYASTTAFRAALETRLNAARTDAVGISRLRKRVVFERLLARLNETAQGAWVLKGGFALELRLAAHARTTKDIDVDFALDEEEAVDLLIDAARLDLDDGIDFATEPVLDPQTIVCSELLAFADVEPVRIPALAVEQHVADSRLGRTAS